MNHFFEFFARNKLLAYMITLLILLSGTGALFTIQRDMFPAVDFGEMVITTRYPGASPEDVELKVTNKIEKELKTVEGIKRFSSWSSENFSMINLTIEPDELDQTKIKNDIRDAVSRVTNLPASIEDAPLVTELNTSVFPIIEVGLTGNIKYTQLKELARSLEKKLENIPGVSRLDRYGWREREIHIEVDPQQLIKHELPINQVIETISNRNVQASGGSFESYTSEKNIVTLAEFRNPAEVNKVVAKTTYEGPMVRIQDIATVIDTFEDERVISRVQGEFAISFVVFKASSADIVRTVDAIKSLVESEQAKLPDGVRAIYSNDASKYVRNRFSIVATNGLLGLAFLVAVLTIFLNIRVAFWVALGIPVAIMGTIFLLPSFGLYLDSITLTALVLVIGIVVDDAIIIAENIYKQYESGKPPLQAAVDGVQDVFRPVLTTVLTTFVAFAPLFFMPGMLGKFVFVIPLAITLALFISLIESCLALPAHIAAGLPKIRNQEKTKNKLLTTLQTKFYGLIQKLMRWRYAVVGMFAIVLLSAIAWASNGMSINLFPSHTADQFVIYLETQNGSSLHATLDKAIDIEHIINELEKSELDSYVTRVGQFDNAVSQESENYASLSVSLTPFTLRKRTADQIVEELREKINHLPNIKRVFFTIDSGGPPVGKPVMIRVLSNNDDIRAKLATDIYAFLETLDGVKDIDRNDRKGKEQIEIKLNYDRLAKLGLNVADVAQTIRVAYDGEIVTRVRYGEDDVAFRVIYPKQVRTEANYLADLHVSNNNGRLIPLRQFADFQPTPGPSTFFHYKGERAIIVDADIDTGITTSLAATNAVTEHFNDLSAYPGARFETGGEAQETNESMISLAFIFAFSILSVYCLLVLLFNSVWQPLLVLAALPFSVIGVITTLALHNEPLGFLAIIGIIGLAGVIVNDALVLVNHINQLAKDRNNNVIHNIIAQGTIDRLRAVLLTSITTIVGLLPLAYGFGGADPYMSPMALVLGYGLLFATPITLILIPCLYMISHDINNLFQKKIQT